QREGFFETIARAADLSGVGQRSENGGDGQSRLGEF
ncbi:MAG: uracil-DNA glycosylase, partial [Halorubrum sp.]